MEHVNETKVPVTESRILGLFVSVCKGLNAMHTCSAGPLAHNDVKVRGHLLFSKAVVIKTAIKNSD